MTTKSPYESVLAKVKNLANQKYNGDVMGNIAAIFSELSADERRLLVLRAVDENHAPPLAQKLTIEEYHQREIVVFKFFCFKALIAWVLSGVLFLMGVGLLRIDCTQSTELTKLFSLALEVFRKIVNIQ